jgi:hypothetical protein
VGGAGQIQLVEAHDAMERHVRADSDDKSPATVGDQKVGIAKSAAKRFGLHGAGPAG